MEEEPKTERSSDAFGAILDVPKSELVEHTERGKLVAQVDKSTRAVIDELRGKMDGYSTGVRGAGESSKEPTVEVQVVEETDDKPGIMAVAKLATGTVSGLTVVLRPTVNGEAISEDVKDSRFHFYEGHPDFVEESGRAGEAVMGSKNPDGGEHHSIDDAAEGDKTYAQMAEVLVKLTQTFEQAQPEALPQAA